MILDTIFFHQKRVGKDGKLFTIYKFRTMYPGAEKDQHKYQHLNIGIPPTFKIHNDPRLTRIGRFLSKTGLDEVAQVINILKGDMALFGPRPLPLDEVKKLPLNWKQKRQSVKPGIISSWALGGSHSLSQKKWIALDLQDIDQLRSQKYKLELALKCCIFFIKQLINYLQFKD